MNPMTAGQLTQIYHLATQAGCGQDKTQYVLQEGYLADFFAGDWQKVNRNEFRELGRLSPQDFGVRAPMSERMVKKIRTVKLYLVAAMTFANEIAEPKKVPYKCVEYCLDFVAMAREILSTLPNLNERPALDEKRELDTRITTILKTANDQVDIIANMYGPDDAKQEDRNVAKQRLTTFITENRIDITK